MRKTFNRLILKFVKPCLQLTLNDINSLGQKGPEFAHYVTTVIERSITIQNQ